MHTCREVWRRDVLHELLDGNVRRADEGLKARHDLLHVVGRDLCGYAHSDAGRPVDEQVWQPRGQHARLHLQHTMQASEEIRYMDRASVMYKRLTDHLCGDPIPHLRAIEVWYAVDGICVEVRQQRV